ncbi:hypothetical protein ACRAKI_12120 [Saccharothrix isguenensis]
MPAEVLRFEVGVAEHARQVGRQQPLAARSAVSMTYVGTASGSRSSSTRIAGHIPQPVWSERTQRGSGSGGGTGTSASSAISQANTAA